MKCYLEHCICTKVEGPIHNVHVIVYIHVVAQGLRSLTSVDHNPCTTDMDYGHEIHLIC